MDLEPPQNLMSEIVARLVQLEAFQNQLQGTLDLVHDQVIRLESRVSALERGSVDYLDDRSVVPGTSISPTLYAARIGLTSMLEGRLERGADPNQEDGHGGTCLVASACYSNPERIRLLIDYGADVRYVYSGDNASILFMLAYVFQDREEGLYREGDYVLAADMLVEAGAPIDAIQHDGESANTALDLLRSMQVEEGSKHDRERRGLISVLEKQYWQGYEGNPFLRASAKQSTMLLLQGAANNREGHVDQTRVRSIRPNLRGQVLDMLHQRGGMRDTFLHLLVAMKRADGASPFIILNGHESSIMPIIAMFAGATGWHRQNLNEAVEVLGHVIDDVEYDVGREQDDYSNDEDGDEMDEDDY